MALEWGVTPVLMPQTDDVEDLWSRSLESALNSRRDRHGRPRRPHRRHGGQPAGLDERDQGRHRLSGASPRRRRGIDRRAKQSGCLASGRLGCSRSAGSSLVAFLYWKPTQTYLHTKQRAAGAERRGAHAARPEGAAREADRPDRDTGEPARARGAPARAREARRAALHRAGHPRLAHAAPLTASLGSTWTDARSSSGSSAARRAHSGASPFAARSARPAVTEQARVRRGRTPVPDAVLRHVPAPRRGDLAPRGGRRRRALDARRRRTTTSSREASPPRRPSSGASAPSSTPASAARRGAGASSACTRMPRSRSRGRATSSATAILAELPALWPDSCCTA